MIFSRWAVLAAAVCVAAVCVRAQVFEGDPHTDDFVLVKESEPHFLLPGATWEKSTKLNLPQDVEMVVTAWKWELIDHDTGEPISMDGFDPPVYMHHSVVHPARSEAEVMQMVFALIGSTDHYNRQLVLPAPYGAFHLPDELDWWMCQHLSTNAALTQGVNLVERITLWWHERRPEDQRVTFDKFGDARTPHPFGTDVNYERRTFVGKFPDLAMKTIGVVYHTHWGAEQFNLRDPMTGERFLEYEVPEDARTGHTVVAAPFLFLDEPYEWIDGQFVYLETLVDMRRVHHSDLAGPMLSCVMFNVYEDPTVVPPSFYGINPDKQPCNPVWQGIPTRTCRHLSMMELTRPWGHATPVQVLPGPVVSACATKEEATCVQQYVYPLRPGGVPLLRH